MIVFNPIGAIAYVFLIAGITYTLFPEGAVQWALYCVMVLVMAIMCVHVEPRD